MDTLLDALQEGRLIELPDTDLLAWVTGQTAPPQSEDTPMFRRLCAFQGKPK